MQAWGNLLVAFIALGLAAYLASDSLTSMQTTAETATTERGIESDSYVSEPITATTGSRNASSSGVPASKEGGVTPANESAVPRPCNKNELRTAHCDERELRAVYERYGRPPWLGFQLESRDDVWAAATEATILEGIAQTSDLPTLTSIDVECRETLCRLEIAFSWDESPAGGQRQNDVLGFAGDFLLPALERAGVSVIRVDPQGTDASMVTYYLGR